MHPKTSNVFFALALGFAATGATQPSPTNSDNHSNLVNAEALQGLKLREIGPALMGGRVADIAVHPRDRNTWYLALGSGGVWKTENAGVTWSPVFDGESSYSIGCVTLDPANPDIVWVGTGENVSGRHVGWGDGVYRSLDGGTTWRNMGLEDSEHIAKILVDPRDGDVVYVAAEGPLWSSGGQRGLYKSTDGGESWTESLVIDEESGVTDIEFDPRNPDVVYAASYQRRRHVWSLMAGGPGSGIHKSTDSGASWRRIEHGLPETDMGKIGLAVSPADPDVVYATIEANAEERGFYRSTDRGERWERRNDYISGGTGPHYYQEIEASPDDVDVVFQMDVFLHVTRDGGATFDVLGTGREKHSDNHALAIDPMNPKHLLAGTDASLYESFDEGQTWRQFPNLPASQFYKLSLDTAEPFYNIVGGAQDLGTLIGPSRTGNFEGVRNRDWYVPLGADGYDCAFDPEDPNTVYMQTQGGNLQRYDRTTHEFIDVRPMPDAADPPERFNWDAPIVVSPHSHTRLYHASQRLWRSDDRGNSWTPVSPDLTRNENRYEQKLMDRIWSVDALYGNSAMSLYGTITTMSESALVEGLLYVGTDDGLIQVSEDGGKNWRAADAPATPERSFVNDIQASRHDPNSVFVAVDAHKTGDFKPYLYTSSDRGRTWSSISGDLPDNEIVWAIEQDHIEANLLFLGAERGLYTSLDGGQHWIRLSGAPTVAFRDVELQRRDNDVVGATFGRGFYILDDYAPLREIARGALEGDGALFPVRDAWWYIPSVPNQARGKPSMGSDDYTADNPPFGASIAYYVKNETKTSKQTRRQEEQQLREREENVPFPGYETLAAEANEPPTKAFLTVRSANGQPVRRIEASAKPGIHRIHWDLRLPPPDPIDLEPRGFTPPWVTPPLGPLAAPGRYEVELSLVSAAGVTRLGEPQSFEVKPVPGFGAANPGFVDTVTFQHSTSELWRQAQGAADEITRAGERLTHMEHALTETPRAEPTLFTRLNQMEARLAALRVRLVGDRIRGRLNESSTPSILGRLGRIAGGHWQTRQAPTETQRRSLEEAERAFSALRSDLGAVLETELPSLEDELEAAGAPWTPGRRLPR